MSDGPARVFVVGCPRSGTTLAHAHLAAHPAVTTLPETYFFRKVFGRLWPQRRFGFVSPRAAEQALARALAELDRRPPAGRRLPRVAPYAAAFTAGLDAAAADAGSSAWVEKSPGHLHCIDVIERHVPEARFVHVVRRGTAVAASFFLAASTDPERWMGQVSGRDWRRRHGEGEALEAAAIEGIVARWNGDVAVTAAHLDRPGHHVLEHRELVADPEPALGRLCDGLGIAFDPVMLDHRAGAERVVGRRRDLPHMAGVLGATDAGGGDPVDGRFGSVFDAVQQEAVRAALVEGGDLDAALARFRPTGASGA